MPNLRQWFSDAREVSHSALAVIGSLLGLQALIATIISVLGYHISDLQLSQDLGKFGAIILAVSKGTDSLNNVFTAKNVSPASVLSAVDSAVTNAFAQIANVFAPAPPAAAVEPIAVVAEPVPAAAPTPVADPAAPVDPATLAVSTAEYEAQTTAPPPPPQPSATA